MTTVKSYGKDIYDVYVRGMADNGQNYSDATVFFERNTIYSYGYHFPMAIRYGVGSTEWYLVNGERYSNTTNKHQAHLRRALQHKQTVTIPFQALQRAGIILDTIELIDQSEATYITRYRYEGEEKVEYQEHLLGAAVFKAQRWDDGSPTWGTFLSGLDSTGRNPHSAYFLAQLNDSRVENYVDNFTVEDAYECLKPEEVREAEWSQAEVLRQGEWFFVRALEDEQDRLKLHEKTCEKEFKQSNLGEQVYSSEPLYYGRNGFLKNRDPERAEQHRATRLIIERGEGEDGTVEEVYVRGTVKHMGGDHKVLKLPNGWYRVYENVQVRGWAVDGSVD